MIILDYQDRRPIYEQITEKFRSTFLPARAIAAPRFEQVVDFPLPPLLLVKQIVTVFPIE